MIPIVAVAATKLAVESKLRLLPIDVSNSDVFSRSWTSKTRNAYEFVSSVSGKEVK